jgi:ankyrin repeat protein
LEIRGDTPLAMAIVQAIRSGDVPLVQRLLAENPGLATAKVIESAESGAGSRSLLHIATDWPGHFPNVASTITALVAAGADVNARFVGRHLETPLHWAASSDDVSALDALLDAGANIEVAGAVIGGGTPLADAIGFRQWNAARRLVERGAQTTLWQAAALGVLDRLDLAFADGAAPSTETINHAFWSACHGGQTRAAEFLLERGADLNWVPPWERMTALDAARRANAVELVEWLETRGAKAAD